ncbi:MAG: ABC transporter permease [Candidatus Korobacteraceae bacterium]
MFARIIFESFRRQQRRKLLAGLAVAMGVCVATAMIAVATDIGDKISNELRSYGANLVVYPDTDSLDVEIGGVNLKPASEGSVLNEADLPSIHGIFWRNNVVGYAPMLPGSATVEGRSLPFLGTYFAKEIRYGKDTFTTGVTKTHPWWKVEGEWPKDDSSDVLLGRRIASELGRGPGDTVSIQGRSLRVAGILTTGGSEEDGVVAPLALAQTVLQQPGAVRRVYVSAVTKPEDELARRDPGGMDPETFDRWFCSPYANSIAFQLQQAIPRSQAEQIRQVAQNEGAVLSRIQGLMLLLTLASLAASALAVSAAMATAILERRSEVGLMKALGAGNSLVATLFLAESGLLALLGGTTGYVAGLLLARQVGRWIFDASIPVQPVLFPLMLLLAVVVTFAGSIGAIRKAMQFDPVFALRGDA